MAEPYKEAMKVNVQTLFQSFFGRGDGRTLFSNTSLDVDIDIQRYNGRKLAVMLPRGTDTRHIDGIQKNTQNEKFTTVSRVFPLIEEEADYQSNQLYFRNAGEAPYTGMLPLARLRARATDMHKEHIRRIVRTFEYLASQAILTGEMDIIIGTADANKKFDFYRKATHTFSVPIAWNGVSPDILNDFDTAWSLIYNDSYMMADAALLGGAAMSALISSETIQTLADNRRYRKVEIGDMPSPAKFQWLIDAGATLQGEILTNRGHRFYLFTYESGIYENLTGTDTRYMPDDQCLIWSSEARCDRYLGPDDKLPNIASKDRIYQEYLGIAPGLAPVPQVMNSGAVLSPEMFYYDLYGHENGKTLTIRTQAAPIFAPISTDAFVTLEDVVT
jgi:hypothetical protein